MRELKHEKASDAVKDLIVQFCFQRLPDRYIEQAFVIVEMVDVHPTLHLERGRGTIWASTIVYVVAQLNKLFRKKSDYDLHPEDISEFYEENLQTVKNKASYLKMKLNLELSTLNRQIRRNR